MRRDNNCGRMTAKTALALTLVITLGAVVFAPQAFAARDLANYLALKGGMYSPSASFNISNIGIDHNTFDANTSNGFNGEIAIGHYFLPSLALEAGVGYFKGKGSIATTPVHPVDFNVIPVILAAKATIPAGPINPYGELGIGAYFTKMNVSNNLNTFNGTTTFGLLAGAGLNVNISRNAFLGVEGRYVTANPSFGNQKIKLNDTEYALNGFKLNGFTTTVNLGFNF